MGLSNSPAIFQKIVDRTFHDIQQRLIFLYLDDAILHGKTIEEQNWTLEMFLQCLREVNLKLQPYSCVFLRTEVIFLGLYLSKAGIQSDERKLVVLRNFLLPKSAKNVRQSWVSQAITGSLYS